MNDVDRLHTLFASGKLLHPYLSREHFANKISSSFSDDVQKISNDEISDNFVDLAASLSICCGVSPPTEDNEIAIEDPLYLSSYTSNNHLQPEIHRRRLRFAEEIGGKKIVDYCNNNVYSRRHIVLILCDGMGNSILQQHTSSRGGGSSADKNTAADTSSSEFFIKHNQPSRLRAVFPSTTPAALTTLATATWPGRHGMPGWNLRDKKGCDFSGSNNENEGSYQPVQLLVLSDKIRDARSEDTLASEMGFSWDEVFIELPWARKLASQHEQQGNDTTASCNSRRRMIYINAYNGDDYQNWVQGEDNNDKERKQSDATDFSAWQSGDTPSGTSRSSLLETAKIEETAYDTLGQPKGSADAIEYFRQGIDIALNSIQKAEKAGESTFTYLYTAHPDKHMHALGVEHEEVTKVVRGIECEVERFWEVLSNRDLLMSGQYHDDLNQQTESKSSDTNDESSSIDAAVVVTADHGHITVNEEDMISLPQNILELLEYACIGVHGKGRHGYLHCRAGLQLQLRRYWQANPELSENFLLLTIEEAIDNGLFGPDLMRWQVRPRLGDFISISIGRKTLVTPTQVEQYKKQCICQGAHGSLLPEEMSIPFVLLKPDEK